MLDPLLRSAGNMASSAAAAALLGAPHIVSSISRTRQREPYRQEASWVLANLEAASRCVNLSLRCCIQCSMGACVQCHSGSECILLCRST